MIDSLVVRSSPHLKALACAFNFEVLQAREHTPTLYPFVVFTLDSQLNLLKSLGVRHYHTNAYRLK
jgi:hypothetical protein